MRIRKVSRTRLEVASLLWMIGLLFVSQSSMAIPLELPEHRVHVPRETINSVEPIAPVSTTIPKQTYTSEELELLYSIAWGEGGDTYLDMVAVTSVVINRVHSQYFPNSIEDVVYQGNGSQFNAIHRENFGYYTEETIDAVQQAIDVNLFEKDVVYFANVAKSSNRNFIEDVILKYKVAEYGAHTFARDARGW